MNVGQTIFLLLAAVYLAVMLAFGIYNIAMTPACQANGGTMLNLHCVRIEPVNL